MYLMQNALLNHESHRDIGRTLCQETSQMSIHIDEMNFK